MKELVFVDDNRALLEMLKIDFEDNFKVEAFSEPHLALEYIKNNSSTINMVIADFKMPVMDGLDILRKTREFNPKIYRVLLTGFMSDVEEKTEQKICHLILDKNILRNAKDLVSKINAILEQK